MERILRVPLREVLPLLRPQRLRGRRTRAPAQSRPAPRPRPPREAGAALREVRAQTQALVPRLARPCLRRRRGWLCAQGPPQGVCEGRVGNCNGRDTSSEYAREGAGLQCAHSHARLSLWAVARRRRQSAKGKAAQRRIDGAHGRSAATGRVKGNSACSERRRKVRGKERVGIVS